MTPELGHALGWAVVLLVVVAAVFNAARHDARERAARALDELEAPAPHRR